MATKIQHRRTLNYSTPFPTLSPGELAFNSQQLKIAMGDAFTGAPLELLAVRFFSTTSSYAANDFIVNAGTLLRAVHPVSPGPFNAADWAGAAAGLSEAPIDGKAYGRKSAVWTQLAAADVTYGAGSVSDVLDNVVTSSSLISDNVTNTSGITGVTVSDSLVYLNNSLIAKAPLISPALTGTPTVPTPPAADSSLTVPNTSWVQARLGAKASILTSDTVPASPADNTLWWESDTAKLYLRYNDGNSSQWVQVNAAAGMGGYVAKIGDSMTGPLILSGNPTLPLGAVTKQYSDLRVLKTGDTMTGDLVLPGLSPATPASAVPKSYADTKLPIMGVTDGSNAAAGQVGEVIAVNASSSTTLTSNTTANVAVLPLTAGDWDVYGEVWLIVGTGGATAFHAAINSASATYPGFTALNTGMSTANFAMPASVGQKLNIRPCRVNLSAPATYYLVALVIFPSGSCTATGNIIARRAR
jgi:hypothetical protein